MSQVVTRGYRDGSTPSKFPRRDTSTSIKCKGMSYLSMLPDELLAKTRAYVGRAEAEKIVRERVPGYATLGEEEALVLDKYRLITSREFNKLTKGRYRTTSLANGVVEIGQLGLFFDGATNFPSLSEAKSVTPMRKCTYMLYFNPNENYREKIAAIYTNAAKVYDPMTIKHTYVCQSNGYDLIKDKRDKKFIPVAIHGDIIYNEMVVDPIYTEEYGMIRFKGYSGNKYGMIEQGNSRGFGSYLRPIVEKAIGRKAKVVSVKEGDIEMSLLGEAEDDEYFTRFNETVMKFYEFLLDAAGGGYTLTGGQYKGTVVEFSNEALNVFTDVIDYRSSYISDLEYGFVDTFVVYNDLAHEVPQEETNGKERYKFDKELYAIIEGMFLSDDLLSRGIDELDAKGAKERQENMGFRRSEIMNILYTIQASPSVSPLEYIDLVLS